MESGSVDPSAVHLGEGLLHQTLLILGANLATEDPRGDRRGERRGVLMEFTHRTSLGREALLTKAAFCLTNTLASRDRECSPDTRINFSVKVIAISRVGVFSPLSNCHSLLT